MARLIVCNKLDAAPVEICEISGSLREYLYSSLEDYDGSAFYTATLNDEAWDHYKHGEELDDSDEIVMTIEPREPITYFIVFAALSAAITLYTLANIPQGYENSSESGKSIYSPNAKANSAVPSGLVRSIAGQPTFYPDLVCPAYRRFEDNKQFLYLMLSLGEGYFDNPQDKVFISETNAKLYGQDIQIEAFEPGDDVSGNTASGNWYVSDEVSNLKLTTASTPQLGDWTVDASGAQFTSYLDGVAVTFPFVVGEYFETTTGSNQGTYEVLSLSGTSDSVATVSELERANGDTGRLDVVQQQLTSPVVSIRFPGSSIPIPLSKNIHPNVYATIDATPVLSPVSDEAVEWTGLNGGVNWEGPFVACPVNETARKSEIDVVFPGGLTDGENEATVELEIQWREYGESEWNTVSDTSYTNSTYDGLGYTIEVDHGEEIRPEWRFRRVTRDANDINVSDVVQIAQVKSKLESPNSYEGITTLAIRLAGTNALASTAENKINIRGATRKLPTLQQIRDEIAGTSLIDLTAANTSTVSLFDIRYAEFLSSTDITEDGPDLDPDTVAVGFSQDGLHLLVSEREYIKSYTLETPFEMGSRTYNGHGRLGFVGAEKTDTIQWTGNGYYVVKAQPSTLGVGSTVSIRPLSTPYDIMNITGVTGATSGYLHTALTGDNNAGVYVSNDGNDLWIVNADTRDVVVYYFNTPFDASDLSTDDDVLTLSADIPNAIVNFSATDYNNDDLPRKIVFTDELGIIYQYTMSTPGDVLTATLDYSTTAISDPVQLVVYEGNAFTTSVDGSNIGSMNRYNLRKNIDSAATRSVVRYVAYVLYSVLRDEAEERIDWGELEDLDTLLESRGDTLDAEFIDETNEWEVINLALGAGYAEATLKEGLFSAVRTTTGTDYEEIYTPDIMIEGVKEDRLHYEEQEPDGVDVEYFSLITNQMEVVECRYTGDLGVNPKRVQAIGITDATKAWRYGMRIRMQHRMKPATYTFSTEMDALNSDYGDPIGIVSDLFVSQFGFVTGYPAETLNVHVDFEPTFEDGETYYAAFRNREGKLSGLYTVELAEGETQELVITGSPNELDFEPVLDGSMEPTLCAFGTADQWGIRAIVKEIIPGGDGTVEVVAEEYVAEVYQYDDSSPP